MIKLYDSEILSILPTYMQDSPRMRAFSYAVKKSNQRLLTMSQKTMLYAALQHAPDEILNVMAVEMRTPFFVESLPIEKKRNLILNTLSFYMRAGTPSVLEDLLKFLFGGGKIEEWYEYGGKPGFFQISIENQYLNAKQRQEFLEQIERLKRKSAHLDVIKLIYNYTTSFGLKNITSATHLIKMYWWQQHDILNASWVLDSSILLDKALTYPKIYAYHNIIFQNDSYIQYDTIKKMNVFTDETFKNRRSSNQTLRIEPFKTSINLHVANFSFMNLKFLYQITNLKTTILSTHNDFKNNAIHTVTNPQRIPYREKCRIHTFCNVTTSLFVATLQKRQNEWYLDNTFALDGTKLLNAIDQTFPI